MLEAINLNFSYLDGTSKRQILKGVNANFEQGKLYTISGQSGSGKTTLLALLSALDEPESGTIKLNNQDIKEIGLSQYRRNHISIVFQHFNLIPYMNALQNVMVAQNITDNKVGTKQEALDILKSVGIDEEKALRNVKKLSGGEQQRVAIARAIATDVEIIIADEPTGNLDSKTQKEIIEILKDLSHNKNKCVIVVTHSKSVTRESDHNYQLKEGILL